jgi:uncharacterized OB-fold protein
MRMAQVTIRCAVRFDLQDALLTVELASRGSLYSFAVVHVDHGDLHAPFTIGEVQQDDGPLIRVTMADGPAAIGDRVQARWATVSTEEDGDQVIEPRFSAASASQGVEIAAPILI